MLIRLCSLVCVLMLAGTVTAQQDCITYKLVPQVTYKTAPVKVTQFVDETVMETKKLTTYKPVWTRETRHRKTTVLKPVTKTSERVERFLVRRPIVETSYVEKQTQETSYQTVTEFKEQRWLVEKPVVETEYQEQRFLVKKPVTRTYLQTEDVTTLKPVTVSETEYVPSVAINGLVDSGRNRLRWLSRGTYVDPLTGTAHNKRAGLHWVPEQQVCTTPVLVEQQVQRTTYKPETVQVQKPVQVTEYVEQIETQKIPVQVSKTSREILVTKIPVTVCKPVTTTSTRKVPVREVKYKEEILVRRVPVTETTYQRVESVEPYEVEVCKWVAETSEIQVPKTVRRRIDYSINQVVPSNDWITVPVDAYGNILSQAENAGSSGTQTVYRYPISENILAAPVAEPTWAGSQTQATIQTLTDAEYEQWLRRQGLERQTSEISANKISSTDSASSVLMPETIDETDVDKPSTDTVDVRRPPLPGNGDAEQDSATTDTDPRDSESGPALNDPGVPEVDDNENESKLEIESSESADIDRRDGI